MLYNRRQPLSLWWDFYNFTPVGGAVAKLGVLHQGHITY